MTEVTVTLSSVRDRIAAAAAAAGRDPASIRLIAVSKTRPPEIVADALAAGQRDFGENYVQEATAKIRTLAGTAAIWHFIGRVQSNKTREIAAAFDWVQTVDRDRIARRLDAQRAAEQPPLNVCIQVGMDDDPGRPGVDPQRLRQLVDFIVTLPRLRLRGLMCMPPLSDSADTTRMHFDAVHSLYRSLCDEGHNLDTLSMGTTGDLEVAVAAGSTMVRVGTAIFGRRA